MYCASLASPRIVAMSPAADFGAALRSCNLRLTFAHDHDRVAIRTHFNAEYIIMVRRMNRDVGRVDFRFRLAILGNAVIEDALAELNLNILVSQIRDICR